MTKQEREARRDIVVKMYIEEEKSINQISKELGVDWATVRRDLDSRNVEVQTIRNQYGSSNGVSNHLFEKIDDSDSAYWLGFLYADGSVRKDRNEIVLDLQEKDLKSVEDFHQYCGNKNSIRTHNKKLNGKDFISYASGFSNAKVKQNLMRLGCVPNKSLILTFPIEEQVPTSYIYDFVRGYIDGDGYIQFDREKHRYRIMILGTEEFLKGLMNRLDLFNHCSISKDKNSSIYVLTISHKDFVLELLEKLYGNSKYHLQRKYDIYKQAVEGA